MHFFGRASGEERIDEVGEDVVVKDGRVFARVAGGSTEFREGSLDDFVREFLRVKGLKGFDNKPVMRENAISVANAYIKSMSIGGK